MELKLENFILALEVTTNIHLQNEAPVVVRITDNATGVSTVFCCSYFIPRYVLLPQNAVWVDMHPESATYRHAFRRTHKAVVPTDDVWEELYFYADAFAQQAYDPEDLQLISIAMPAPATVQTHGIGYLSTEGTTVITDGDARLTDDRNPLPHDAMHPETPATMVAGTSVVTQIADSTPVLHSMLVKESTDFVWRKLKESDVGGAA